MHGELRGIYSDDVDDLVTYHPPDPDCFSLYARAWIGPSEPRPEGETSVAFRVCTATWLAQHPPPKGFEFVRGTLLLSRWDYSIVERAIGDLCLHIDGATWIEVVTKLAMYIEGELQDF
jgi:hypothetical protein